MPFHGLASKIVLSALQDGQQEGVFVGTLPGHAQVSGLVAGHRRASCEPWAGGVLQRFLNSGGNTYDASEEVRHRALQLRESSGSGGLGLGGLVDASFQEHKVIADVPSNTASRHPFWHFETHQLRRYEVIICACVLFFAGLLCSAGGIGGGGIYVTLLMVAGGLGVVDAVPLSKAVVFLGSVPSLVLNLRKSMSSSTKTLIDYNICRLVVPSSLMGTFLGVLFNRILPSWVVLLVLSMVLICMTVMVTRTTIEQYMEEDSIEAVEEKDEKCPGALRPPAIAEGELDPRERAFIDAGASLPSSARATAASRARRRSSVYLPGSGAGGIAGAGSPTTMGGEVVRFTSPPATSGDESPSSPADSQMRNTLSRRDIYISLTMLVIVVLCSILRYHAGQCKDAHTAARQREVCHHPTTQLLGNHTLKVWTHDEGSAEFLMSFTMIFPCAVCLVVALYYSIGLIRSEGWDCCSVLSYDVMALCTGCLAGLVGIGGGLVFSPFFLLMSVDPGIAVATSSTCVIFTSSSTTLQYVFTDRVIMSLASVYGLVNIVASYSGTKFVHFLMDDFHTRRSYISAIVGMGVLISAVLSLVKLATSASSMDAAH